MPARFTYSRWDGTQTGFSLDAEGILDELTDDLLYHGDLNAALRRLMRDGMTDPDGNQIEGLRDMMQRIRDRKKELEESGDLGGVYSEIADALKDIIDEERHAVENSVREAEASGDERRADTARDAAMERNFRLDMMPNDLAGMVREMQSYDFESSEAQQRFEELMDKLRQEMMQQFVDQMSEGMQNMSPEDMARMKDMMAALNGMIEAREQGEDPQFENSWSSSAISFRRIHKHLTNFSRTWQSACKQCRLLWIHSRQNNAHKCSSCLNSSWRTWTSIGKCNNSAKNCRACSRNQARVKDRATTSVASPL